MNAKKAIYLLLGLIIVFVFLPNTTFAASKMPKGTQIANVQVENKTEAEIRKLLEDEIVIWKAQDNLVLEGEYETLSITREVFKFDVDATMNELKQKTKRTLTSFFKRPKNVQVSLEVSIDETHSDMQQLMDKSYIDYADTLDKLLLTASNLENNAVSLTYVDGKDIPLETVATVKFPIPELSKATLEYIVDELNGYTVEPNGLFSFLQAIETPEKLLNSRDESSFLGTALYALFLQADFEIIERHAQLTLPSYGEKGVNAEVNKRENKDLIVINRSDSPYRININYSNKEIELNLESNEPLYTYEVEVQNEKEIKPRTLYRYSKKVNPGEHQVIQEGKNGLKVDIYRSKFEDGLYVGETLVSKDLYLPVPRILLVSPNELELDDLEVEIDPDDDSIRDENGEIIRPDGSGGSIADLLPDDLKGTDIYDQIKEADRTQQQYEEFLEKLLEIYANNLDTNSLEQIVKLEQRIEALEFFIESMLAELVKNGHLDEDFVEQLKDGVNQ